MKKILLATLLLIGISSFANAKYIYMCTNNECNWVWISD